MNIFKKLKLSTIMDAILCCVAGLILILWPGATMTFLCKALSIILICAGIVLLITFFTAGDRSFFMSANFLLGLVVTIIGVWIFMRPEIFIALIPAIAGIMIIVGGVINLTQTVSLISASYRNWWVALILAVITILLGIFLIFYPLDAVGIAVRIVGVIMLYNGISNMWVVSRVSKFVKDAKQDAEAVDTEGKEI